MVFIQIYIKYLKGINKFIWCRFIKLLRNLFNLRALIINSNYWQINLCKTHIFLFYFKILGEFLQIVNIHWRWIDILRINIIGHHHNHCWKTSIFYCLYKIISWNITTECYLNRFLFLIKNICYCLFYLRIKR